MYSTDVRSVWLCIEKLKLFCLLFHDKFVRGAVLVTSSASWQNCRHSQMIAGDPEDEHGSDKNSD